VCVHMVMCMYVCLNGFFSGLLFPISQKNSHNIIYHTSNSYSVNSKGYQNKSFVWWTTRWLNLIKNINPYKNRFLSWLSIAIVKLFRGVFIFKCIDYWMIKSLKKQFQLRHVSMITFKDNCIIFDYMITLADGEKYKWRNVNYYW